MTLPSSLYADFRRDEAQLLFSIQSPEYLINQPELAQLRTADSSFDYIVRDSGFF